MLTAKNLERIMELENSLRAEYQVQLDAKDAEIEAAVKEKEVQTAVVAKQLEQIKELSPQVAANKRVEQLNRELTQRCENLQEEVASQKKRIKSLQKELAAERDELKTLKQYDPARMKKNLDSNKKKLVEKTAAADLLQKNLNKTKSEKADLQRQVQELEAKLAELEPAEAAEETREAEEAAA
jgi:septal ring factor EnvC (AmiA/AmiB activator)